MITSHVKMKILKHIKCVTVILAGFVGVGEMVWILSICSQRIGIHIQVMVSVGGRKNRNGQALVFLVLLTATVGFNTDFGDISGDCHIAKWRKKCDSSF